MTATTATRTLPVADDHTRGSDRLRRGVAIIAASVLVALGAHVSIALPFTPVPIVLSDFAVILMAMLLGPAAGCAVMLAYLAEGAAGMPVFSPHGAGGVAQLLGPTGGFLISYPIVALVAGVTYRGLRRRLGATFAAATAGIAATMPLFLLGASWLALLSHLPAARVLQLAVTPFLAGACVKVLVAACIIASLHRLARQSSART